MSADEQRPPGRIALEPGELATWIEREPDLQLLDVREQYEHEAGHIAGSRRMALGELSGGAGTLDAARPVVMYCRVGARSDMAAQALRGAGFEAYSMSGGLLRWASEGRPLSPADGTVADH